MNRETTENLRGLINNSKMCALNILSNYKVYECLDDIKECVLRIREILEEDDRGFYEDTFSDLIKRIIEYIDSYSKVKINKKSSNILGYTFEKDVKDILVDLTIIESVFGFFQFDMLEEDKEIVFDATM